jgi:hypothetical protein
MSSGALTWTRLWPSQVTWMPPFTVTYCEDQHFT